VTKTQSAGPISCLEHRATRVLYFDWDEDSWGPVLGLGEILPIVYHIIIINLTLPSHLPGAATFKAAIARLLLPLIYNMLYNVCLFYLNIRGKGRKPLICR